MKECIEQQLKELLQNYSVLQTQEINIRDSFLILKKTYENKGKLLVCGNGGSAADSDHIVGELMKGFKHKRALNKELVEQIKALDLDLNHEWVDSLQQGLPAINLSAQSTLCTAISNDIGYEEIFAQQVIGYGRKGDCLLGISTSGNSLNVIKAGISAKALGMKTIGLTGAGGGKMKEIFDVVIEANSTITAKIQELHLPIYHTLCAMLEADFFIIH